MVSQATTIRNSLSTNWALTGRLTKTSTSTVTEVVRFFDREQVLGNEWPKAVIVRKINTEAGENLIEHPHFTEVRDVYEISCFYRVVDVKQVTYSDALEDVEDMATEIQRILKLTYSPDTGTGIFYTSRQEWRKEDLTDQSQPELRRTMRFTLTKIRSEAVGVFEGYDGVLVFSGHTYAEAFNVETSYGSDQQAEPITGNPNGNKIPLYFTNPFSGTFSADMMLNNADISASNFGVNTIGDHDSDGEVLEASFVQTYKNKDAAPSDTLTFTTLLKITRAIPVAFVEDLVRFRLTAEVIKYPTMTVA